MKFSRPVIRDALRRLLLPDQTEFPVEFGELLGGNIQVLNLDDSPFSELGPTIGRVTDCTPAVDEYAIVAFGPAAKSGVPFQLKQVRVCNPSAFACYISLRVLTAAQLTTAGLAAVGFMRRMVPPYDGTGASVTSHVVYSGSHTTPNLGQEIGAAYIAAGTMGDIILPNPGATIIGDNSPCCWAIISDYPNVPFGKTSIHGREWPQIIGG